jgi:MoxR-like ATPase
VSQSAVSPQTPGFADLFDRLLDNITRVVTGKREVVHLALVALFAEGHLLTGVSVWNRATGEFEFRPGGVFANVVLADEINRASPKTHAALLEAMEEQQVTVDSRTYPLKRPFLVVATQNPIELEGTYALPEAQLDRFLMRLEIGYPDRSAELEILESQKRTNPVDDLEPVFETGMLESAMDIVQRVHVSDGLRGYIVDIVETTRRHRDLILGVSPRGALGLQRAARALAASVGREYVIPDDVKLLARPVLGHRIIVATEARLRDVTADEVLAGVLDSVPVPGPPTQ